MIFAAETDERSLHVFPDAATASVYCDGVAVESAMWMFWDDSGAPLAPFFTIPNKRGLLVSKSGQYHLVPATDGRRPLLSESLARIRQVIGEASMNNVQAVQAYLAHPSRCLAEALA